MNVHLIEPEEPVGHDAPITGESRSGEAQDPGCICRGNWRLIVSEIEGLIGKKFLGYDGKEYKFFGLVHGDDDYYYGMWNKDGLRLLSCVGSIEGHGYTQVAT